MSNEEVEKLRYCSETLNISESDVIRLGIEKVYNEMKKVKVTAVLWRETVTFVKHNPQKDWINLSYHSFVF